MTLHGFQMGKKLPEKNQYFGKYRATVTKNADPLKMGRIKVKCPKVLGDYESPWALPCLPPGYSGVPNKGDLVWVEFEEGNQDMPIWSGIWYKERDYPLTNVDDLKILTRNNLYFD